MYNLAIYLIKSPFASNTFSYQGLRHFHVFGNRAHRLARIFLMAFLTLSLPKNVNLRLRMGSRLSLAVTNPLSFGDFPKIKKN